MRDIFGSVQAQESRELERLSFSTIVRIEAFPSFQKKKQKTKRSREMEQELMRKEEENI